MGYTYPDDIDYWVTLHPEKFKAWQDLRAKAGHNTDYIAVCHEGNTPFGPRDHLPRIDKITDYRYPGMTGSGSSGLLAVKVAQDEGFNRIVLAGVPMQVNQAHFFDGRPWDEHWQFVEAWKIARSHLELNVRSMSGWTQELLGAPTTEWLRGASLPNQRC